MQENNRTSIQSINPLIKLVKQREELYFELLSFVNKNIQSSSNDLDNLTIFNKFVVLVASKHSHIKARQIEFLGSFSDTEEEKDRPLDDPNSKEMLRLTSRVIEILEASIAKVRKSVFDDSGRTAKQFTRFKTMLHKILKRQSFYVRDFVEYIINYCNNKYEKQFGRIEKYIEKVEQGEDIWLRQMYFKQNSDAEQSPDQKKTHKKIEVKLEKKMDKIQRQHISSCEENQKKVLRKPLKTSIKKRERLLNIKKMKQQQNQQPPSKQQTANKLLKFYNLMQLNKKQFLEDYVYQKIEQQRHKEQLMNCLLERNKTINSQINNFIRKSSAFIPTPLIVNNKSSGEERNQSLNSKTSLRTSFIISKRKASFHIESSNNEKNSDSDKKEHLDNMIKNINPRRRSSHSNHRPQEKSKKLFVVKTPMVFQDEMIPQAQITQTQWLQAPLTMKGKQRKNQNIRLKRRNNPNPLQNTFLPETFRYAL